MNSFRDASSASQHQLGDKAAAYENQQQTVITLLAEILLVLKSRNQRPEEANVQGNETGMEEVNTEELMDTGKPRLAREHMMRAQVAQCIKASEYAVTYSICMMLIM